MASSNKSSKWVKPKKIDPKKAQNQSVWENGVIPLYDMIKGTEADIERLLGISLSKLHQGKVMDKVDTIIELAIELGIKLGQCEQGQCALQRLYRTREERTREVTVWGIMKKTS